MALWTDLVTTVQREVNDTAGTFSTSTSVRRALEWGEALLSLQRGLYEWTEPMALTAGQPLYTVHASTPTPALQPPLPLFILPLRITLKKVPLRRTTLASLSRTKARWWAERETPESFFMVGGTLLGFSPVPESEMTVVVTFLSYPPTTTTTPPPAVGTSPAVADEWHTALQQFAEAIELGRQGEIAKATEKLQQFVQSVGIKRDVRFAAGSSSKPADTAQVPAVRAEA